jgi:flavodoxin I
VIHCNPWQLFLNPKKESNMSKVAIVYGSTTGNTTEAAKQIQATFSKSQATLFEISSTSPEQLEGYQLLIFGTPTWGYGDLQDDWECKLDLLANLNLQGQKVALFGLGDQQSYPDTYLNAMGTLYNAMTEEGAVVIGFWPTEGYEFTESTAVRNHRFVGLALDYDNQSAQQKERIEKWVAQLRLL